MSYKDEIHGNQGRVRHGSPTFYELLDKMAKVHDKKSHDYASNDNPYGNYHFAGELSKLFNNPKDAGFVGRIGEKLFRLANLENRSIPPKNESIEDTEDDIAVIICLWIADRRDRRSKFQQATEKVKEQMREGTWEGFDNVSGTKLPNPANRQGGDTEYTKKPQD